jgi:hypothetical protein
VKQLKILAFLMLNTFVICGADVYAQQEISQDDIQLTQCIGSHMRIIQRTVPEYGDADKTSHTFCAKELSVWSQACQGKYLSDNGSESGVANDSAISKCESEYRELAKAIVSELASNPPPTANQANFGMGEAMRDLRANRPLPGLPNLNKSVFVIPQSIICESPGELANPNTQMLLKAGVCAVSDKKIKVTVLLPRDEEEYISDHVHNMVSIKIGSRTASVGNVFIGWVKIPSLKN